MKQKEGRDWGREYMIETRKEGREDKENREKGRERKKGEK